MQALWVLLAAFFFATMSVGVKVAGASFSISEVVFYRGAVSVLFMAVVVRARGECVRGSVRHKKTALAQCVGKRGPLSSR